MPRCCKIRWCDCCNTGMGDASTILKGKELPILDGCTLVDYFNECVSNKKFDPDSVALIYNGNVCLQYTYAEFQDLSMRLASSILAELSKTRLRNFNEDGEMVIGFCIGNTDKFILLIFAILQLKIAYLPIDFMTCDEEIVQIYKAVKPILMIIEDHGPVHTRFMCIARVVRLVTIGELLDVASTLPSNTRVDPLNKKPRPWNETAAIYYTAGTTGQRKGVRIRHKEILNRISWQWDAFPYDPDDLASLTSQAMIHTSIADIFAPLLSGTPLVILNRVFRPKADFIIDAVEKWSISRITVSSTVLASILDAIEKSDNPLSIKQSLSTVKIWFCVGDSLSFELGEKFFAVLGRRQIPEKSGSEEFEEKFPESPPCDDKRASSGDGSTVSLNHSSKASGWKSNFKKALLVHLYGTTETTADATFESFEDLSELLGKSSRYQLPLGIPIANSAVYICEDTCLLAKDNIGEICVSGACLAWGYTVEKTNEGRDFVQTCTKAKALGYRKGFQSKDLGRISEGNDGVLRVYPEGRVGAIAKVKGAEVDLAAVAKVIRATGLVEDVECVIYNPEREDQVVVAATILKPDAGILDILSEIKDKIPKGARPEIFPVPQIPLLADGRMDRRMILDTFRKNKLMCRSKDWSRLGLPANKLDAARTLCEAVAHSIGLSIKYVIDHFHDSYWELGGTSNNAVIAVCRVKAKNYYLGLDDFISARSLEGVMNKMLETDGSAKQEFVSPACNMANNKYIVTDLLEKHKADVIKIISECYPDKNDLAVCTHSEECHFQIFLAEVFQFLLRLNLSVVAVSRRTEQVVGVMLNVDSHIKPKLKRTPKPVKYIFELFDAIDNTAKQKMKYGTRSKIIEPYLMGTSETCKPGHNVLLMQLLLKATVDKAKTLSYTDIFVISGLPLIRHLCRFGYKYTVLVEYRVDMFVAADKVRPFRNAGTYHKVYCFSKNLLL